MKLNTLIIKIANIIVDNIIFYIKLLLASYILL